MKTRRLVRGVAASLEGRLRPAKSAVDASPVIVDSEAIQLAMEVEAVPEVGPVRILARALQGYEPVANCGRLSIRPGRDLSFRSHGNGEREPDKPQHRGALRPRRFEV